MEAKKYCPTVLPDLATLSVRDVVLMLAREAGMDHFGAEWLRANDGSRALVRSEQPARVSRRNAAIVMLNQGIPRNQIKAALIARFDVKERTARQDISDAISARARLIYA